MSTNFLPMLSILSDNADSSEFIMANIDLKIESDVSAIAFNNLSIRFTMAEINGPAHSFNTVTIPLINSITISTIRN